MSLRCLLFSSDEAVATPICEVLAGLDVEAEYCSEAVPAVEKVTSQSYQIVIIDWDDQPEAGLLLTSARERKASERPLTLAIVGDDASVPKALQAGANSILRKPIQSSQVKDTLTTARALLRAKQESAVSIAQAAAAGTAAGSQGSVTASPTPASHTVLHGNAKTVRAGEFLPTSTPSVGAHFVTDSDEQQFTEQTAAAAVDPLQELEPMAAAGPEEQPAPRESSEPRGLQWYLNARAAKAPAPPVQALEPEPEPPAPGKPELLAFDQTPSALSETPEETAEESAPSETHAPRYAPHPGAAEHHQQRDQKAEAKLFAYISDGAEPEPEAKPPLRLGKAIIGALVLATCGIVVAPQAPWHPQVLKLWAHEQRALHSWLNPQPVITPQAPASHENFGRAGDEYKLPQAENIPDATTDPSQIRVVPVVDPTAKKPAAGAADPNATDPANTSPVDPPAQSTGAPVQETQPPAPGTTDPGSKAPSTATPQPAPAEPPHADPVAAQPAAAQPVAPKPEPAHASTPANNSIPSSLRSQMASPGEPGGNKPVESALPSIEPVVVAEAAERALLTDQPAIAYPDSAKGQQGTVILQVLIGRDGSVQDAKFMQGSLAFARTAIDGVKQWKFKPYLMNGRAASVQTQMTMSFKPTA
jgi:periplasmic protein TonB